MICIQNKEAYRLAVKGGDVYYQVRESNKFEKVTPDAKVCIFKEDSGYIFYILTN